MAQCKCTTQKGKPCKSKVHKAGLCKKHYGKMLGESQKGNQNARKPRTTYKPLNITDIDGIIAEYNDVLGLTGVCLDEVTKTDTVYNSYIRTKLDTLKALESAIDRKRSYQQEGEGIEGLNVTINVVKPE